MKIAEHVCECIFEQTKRRIVIVLVLGLTKKSYLNVSSVSLQGNRHFFYTANQFWENGKTLFIAEPRSDFNSCYKQQNSENHKLILFIAVYS